MAEHDRDSTPVMRHIRKRFLGGHIVVEAMPVKPRDPKPLANYREKPERIPTKGGTYKPKRKLTGAIPLKVRKQMLAVKLRNAGCRTVAGMVNKRHQQERARSIRLAKRRAERERQAIAA